MKGRLIAETIESVVRQTRESKPHLFTPAGVPHSMDWELLREVREQANEKGVNPKKILQVLGFDPMEYERIIF